MAKRESRYRTFRYRLHPTVRQAQLLSHQLEFQREIYNAALQERINVWKREQRSVSYFEQCRTLTELREVRPDVLASGVRLCRGTLKKLDRSFLDFFRRVQGGEKPGFPRFKTATRFTSLQWEDSNGWRVEEDLRRLYLPGIGHVKANYHRRLSGLPRAITVKREGKKWWLSVRCRDVPASPLASTGREIGIDLGVVNIIATSDGEVVTAGRFGRRIQAQITEAQRAQARCRRGSTRYEKRAQNMARLYRKASNQRRDAAHQLSRRLVNDFDLIAVENLEVAKMTRFRRRGRRADRFDKGKAKASIKRGRARSIYDAGWGTLLSLLLYKAESAGRVVVMVDPRYTSQTCAECGHVEAGNRVSQSRFRCCACGHCDHADVNAARNILWAGRALQAQACVG